MSFRQFFKQYFSKVLSYQDWYDIAEAQFENDGVSFFSINRVASKTTFSVLYSLYRLLYFNENVVIYGRNSDIEITLRLLSSSKDILSKVTTKCTKNFLEIRSCKGNKLLIFNEDIKNQYRGYNVDIVILDDARTGNCHDKVSELSFIARKVKSITSWLYCINGVPQNSDFIELSISTELSDSVYDFFPVCMFERNNKNEYYKVSSYDRMKNYKVYDIVSI